MSKKSSQYFLSKFSSGTYIINVNKCLRLFTSMIIINISIRFTDVSWLKMGCFFRYKQVILDINIYVIINLVFYIVKYTKDYLIFFVKMCGQWLHV